ncbi:hypothetical protein [Ornithinimicrobium sp. INDO-MA30-4]|nr:hypothetical protein [Ornithinimicrobium sp. INDO-MA30-4]
MSLIRRSWHQPGWSCALSLPYSFGGLGGRGTDVVEQHGPD